MSPEQAAGEGRLDGRSDVYSLACVLFEMVSGAPVFTGAHDLAVIARRFSGPAPKLDDVCPFIPRHVSDAVAKALAVDPNERFSCARDFADALLSTSAVVTRSWRRRFSGRNFSRTVAKLTRSAALAIALLLCA